MENLKSTQLFSSILRQLEEVRPCVCNNGKVMIGKKEKFCKECGGRGFFHSDLILNYAKSNCSKCLGKGYQEFYPLHSKQLYKKFCQCVLDNVKKEVKEIVKIGEVSD